VRLRANNKISVCLLNKDLDRYRINIANEFNNYFVNVGANLVNNIVQPELKGVDVDIIKWNTSSIFLKPVEENELLNTIKKLKVKNPHILII